MWVFVARMERSAIRDRSLHGEIVPGFRCYTIEIYELFGATAGYPPWKRAVTARDLDLSSLAVVCFPFPGYSEQ